MATTPKSPGTLPGRDLSRILAGLLFVGPKPLSFESFQRAYPAASAAAFHLAVGRLAARYRAERRPYRIRRRGEGYFLELVPEIASRLARNAPAERGIKLPRAAVEVLALVAYRQPITRGQLEELLGTDVGGPLRQLRRQGLIVAAEDESRESRPYITTHRFLEQFHLSSLADLPVAEEPG